MVVEKTYLVQIHRTRPVIIHHKKKSNRVFYLLLFLISIAVIITNTYCMIYNIGPMNEMACFYKQTHNPTYKEMLDFINMDTTETNQYSINYVCHNFSMDVIKNAKSKGMEAGYVTILAEPTNHAIVAFKTTDKGVYYLEPQSDIIFAQSQMDFMINQHRYKLNDDKGGMDMEMFSYSINWFSGLL
jgi:hypothetical protein